MKLADALVKARESGKDLIEVTAKANPPVVKIIDFQKFRYEEAKRERQARKKTRETHTKEIWLGPSIGEHDLEVRLKRSEEFFSKGDRVKFTVKFSGREMAHTELGFKLLEKLKEILSETAEADGVPRLMGRNLSLSFRPVKIGHNENKTQN